LSILGLFISALVFGNRPLTGLHLSGPSRCLSACYASAKSEASLLSLPPTMPNDYIGPSVSFFNMHWRSVLCVHSNQNKMRGVIYQNCATFYFTDLNRSNIVHGISKKKSLLQWILALKGIVALVNFFFTLV
jgi:hypothetical protein